MRNFKRLSILVILLCSFFFLAWNPLKPVFNFFAAAFSGGETSIPLPLPNVQVGITGKPAFSLNIQVPPGAGDLVPTITIDYTSGGNQSILGRGWNLGGFPSVLKNPNLGVHFGTTDGYSSSLLGELIATSTSGIYRSKLESFYKSTFDGSSWVLRNPSGVTYSYGANSSSGSSSIVQGDSGPVAFYLDKVRDPFGNGYDITYNPDTLASPEPLPQEIKYTRGNARIAFSYTDRPGGWKEQVFYLTNNGFRKKVLSKIQVYANDSSGSEQLTETYDFEYDSSSELGPLLSSFERSNYKPVVFSYSERAYQSTTLSSSSKNFDISYQAEDPTVQTNCANTQAACLCSANAVCMAASWGLAAIYCAEGIAAYQDICTNGITTSFVSPADTDGDGSPELIRVSGSKTSQKFSVTKLSDWETASGNSLSGSTTLVGNNIGITSIGRILVGDYNGDGKSDFLVLANNGSPLKVYYGPDFSSATYSSITVQGLSGTSAVLKHFAVDVNGDGKTDFLQADSSNNLIVYTSTGSGFQKIQTLAITTYGTDFQQFTDFDHNGIPDYSRIDGTTTKDFLVTFLDFQNGLLQVIETKKVSRTDFGKTGDQFISDINGDGYLDFAFFAISGSQGTISYYPFTGRTFLANGASPLQTVDVDGAYANQVSGSSAATTYVNVDLSGDGVKDRVSYNNSNTSNSFFNVEIYDITQAKYLTSFQVPWNQDTSRDLNGDGALDILRADTSSQQQTDSNGVTSSVTVTKFEVTITNGTYYEVAIDLDSYVPATSITSDASSMAYFNWRNRKDLIDLNMDGKADFLRYDASNSTLSVSYAKSDSNGYVTYSQSGDDSWTTGGYFLALDANGDGRPEILGLNANKINLQTSRQSSAPAILTNVYRTFPYESSVQLHYIRFKQDLPSGLLTSIENGATSSAGSLKLGIDYQLSRNHSGAIQPGLYDSTKPQFVPFTGADYLVTGLSQKIGTTNLGLASYQYSFARLYLAGFRNNSYIGFQKIRQTDGISNESIVTKYDPTFIEMGGVPTSLVKTKNGIKLSELTNTYLKTSSILGGTLVQQASSTEVKYQGGQTLNTTSVAHVYDTYGNETSKSININGNIVLQSTTYQNDWNAGFVGQPTEIQITSNGELVSDKKINYSNSQIAEIKDLVSIGVWRSSLIQSYDEYGNPTAMKDTAGNVNAIEYDSIVHKFPVKITNSLGHITQKTNDYTTGILLSSTNPNGGISRTEYDTFGRAVTSYLPGESDWSEKIEYENSGDLENCLIRKKFRRANGESWQEESSNAITKVSKKRSSLVNSLVLVEESYQNQEGQTIKKVDSYIEGSNPFTSTTYTYDSEGNLSKSERSDGKTTEIVMDGSTTTITASTNGTQIGQLIEVMDSFGKVISRTKQGKTIQFQYGANGKVSQIQDPDNGTTIIETDIAGRQTKVTNSNSGTITSIYDSVSGKMQEQRYANGSKVQYSFDVLGRPVLVQGIGSQGDTVAHVYEYDGTDVSYGIGRLTKVTDPLGTTELGYDIRGNQSALKKTLTEEELTFIIQKKYNLQNQIEEVTYPDGSIAKNLYSTAGYLSGITLTPADGSGSDFPVAQYNALIENGNLKIQRILGNGVQTNIIYDPIERRPLSLQTVKDSAVYENVNYSYDDLGNYTEIQDQLNPIRSQTFSYDNLSRLTSATGVYGTEQYQYSDSGKLLKKGDLAYSYSDPTHRNAVTQVNGPDANYSYIYDESGNVINRNGNGLSYDPFQKLKSMQTIDQGIVTFDYDFTGTRIRKVSSNDGTKTISLGGIYEVVLSPGKGSQHTLYFKGDHDDLVGQWSRTNATLLSGFTNSQSLGETSKIALNTLLWNTKDVSIRGLKFFLFSPKANFTIFGIVMLIGLGFALLYMSEGIWKASLKFATPILILSLSNCNLLVPGGSGTSPWAALPLIDNTSGAGMPVSGFIFLHPDHLGSITMATDGNGNRITGGTQAGASHFSYKPYGEINQDDSFGPDVFRYKYTGQEKDSETGLYYYKARYYDPLIGRFMQADSQMDGNSPVGMDVYMYTEGNPIRYVDPSGHSWVSGWLSKAGLGFLNFNIAVGAFLQRAFYVSSQRFSDFGDRALTSLGLDNGNFIHTNARGGRDSKEGSWFDRQVTDPIQHMSTQELIVAFIVFAISVAAAYYLGPIVGEQTALFVGSALEGTLIVGSAQMIAVFLADVAFGIALTYFGAGAAEVLGSLSKSSTKNIRYDKETGVGMRGIGASAADMGGLYGSFLEVSTDHVFDLAPQATDPDWPHRPTYKSIAMGGSGMEGMYDDVRPIYYVEAVPSKVWTAAPLSFYSKTVGAAIATCAIYKGNKDHECSF